MLSGCFSRPTEAVKKTEGGSNFERLEKLKGGGNPKTKGKGTAPKAGTGASKPESKTSEKAKDSD
jgi:hypothetical protein